MRAVVIDGPGRLALRDVPAPERAPGECRVAVTLAGICRTDLELARGYMGFVGIPGHEFVGVVTEGPPALAGRRVVGEINVPEDLSLLSVPGYDARHEPRRTVLGILGRPGAFAEMLRLPPANLLVVPDDVADEEAVFVEPLAAALAVLDRTTPPPGRPMLVVGDGKLGLLIAQVCTRVGHRVVLCGHHPRKLALARRWGVEDFVPGAATYPLVIEATGSPAGLKLALDVVEPRGTVVLKSTYAPGELAPLDSARVVVNEISLIGSRCGRFAPALRLLAEHRVDVKSLIDAEFPLAAAPTAFAKAGERGVLKILLRVRAPLLQHFLASE